MISIRANEFWRRTKLGLKPGIVAVLIFWGAFILTLQAKNVLFPPNVHPQRGALLLILFVLPFFCAWASLKVMKRWVSFSVPVPETAAAGLALGFAAVAWFLIASAAGGDMGPTSPSDDRAATIMQVVIATIAMTTGAVTTSSRMQRDWTLLIFLVSPVAAIVATLIGAYAITALVAIHSLFRG